MRRNTPTTKKGGKRYRREERPKSPRKLKNQSESPSPSISQTSRCKKERGGSEKDRKKKLINTRRPIFLAPFLLGSPRKKSRKREKKAKNPQGAHWGQWSWPQPDVITERARAITFEPEGGNRQDRRQRSQSQRSARARAAEKKPVRLL